MERAAARRPGASATVCLLALALLAGACAERDAEPAAVAVRDSAGIAIIESARPRWRQDGWQVADTPSLRIGVAQGAAATAFAGILAIERTEDGGIVVSERTGIRQFDGTGGLVRRIGREGAGAGEFGYIMSAVTCAGRIVVADYMRQPVSVFDVATGEFITSQTVSGVAAGTVVQPVACSGDGFVAQLVPRPERQTAAPEVHRVRMPLVATDGTFTIGDTLAVVLGPELYDGLVRPFGRHEAWASDAHSLYTMDTQAAEVRVRTIDSGRLRRIVRIGLPARDVTEADVARIRTQYLDGVPAALAERELLPRLNAVPIPERMPATSQLEVDGAGYLWLREHQPFRDEPVRTWHVVAPGGAWLGAVDMPRAFTPHVFGRDEVIGVWRDELGVEYVHAYPLLRGDDQRNR